MNENLKQIFIDNGLEYVTWMPERFEKITSAIEAHYKARWLSEEEIMDLLEQRRLKEAVNNLNQRPLEEQRDLAHAIFKAQEEKNK